MKLRSGGRGASIRLRLTLTYSALFVVAGASLLAVNYFLVRFREHGTNVAVNIVCNPDSAGLGLLQAGPGQASARGVVDGPLPPGCRKVSGQGAPSLGFGAAQGGASTRAFPLPADGAQQRLFALAQVASQGQNHALHTLVIESIIALGLMAVASLGLGWLVAGRALRPVHRITDTARRLSEETLHERIHLEGPDDELKELADTFDAMLARLDQAFAGQRRFVANASHELRTPLATERVLIDEALANRGASPGDLRSILEDLRANNEQTERLIDALLVLARSEQGVERWQPVDLGEIAGQIVHEATAEATTVGITLRAHLEPAPTIGDPALLQRLVGNLVENAIRHNRPGEGWVEVSTTITDSHARLLVTNSGRVLAAEHVAALFEPFHRHTADRTTGGGFGLGLSIVESVVAAHDGRLTTAARPEGGLEVSVDLRPRPVLAPV